MHPGQCKNCGKTVCGYFGHSGDEVVKNYTCHDCGEQWQVKFVLASRDLIWAGARQPNEKESPCNTHQP